MISFEIGKETEKDVFFHLVTRVGLYIFTIQKKENEISGIILLRTLNTAFTPYCAEHNVIFSKTAVLCRSYTNIESAFLKQFLNFSSWKYTFL